MIHHPKRRSLNGVVRWALDFGSFDERGPGSWPCLCSLTDTANLGGISWKTFLRSSIASGWWRAHLHLRVRCRHAICSHAGPLRSVASTPEPEVTAGAIGWELQAHSRNCNLAGRGSKHFNSSPTAWTGVSRWFESRGNAGAYFMSLNFLRQ